MRLYALSALVPLLLACDSKKETPASNSVAVSASAPASSTAPAPTGKRPFTVMPDMFVDDSGIGIGPERIETSKADAQAKLDETAERIPIDNKQVALRTTPKAAIRDVAMVVTALGKRGAPSVSLKMEGGRKDLPGEYVVVPESRITEADACSVVTTVLEDYSTGAWPFKGGGGKKATKGRAGPDLSITGENVASLLKGCSSKVAFFSANAKLRWEHAFHAGAVIKKADTDNNIDKLVFLSEEPVAGLPVKLKQ